MSHCKDCKYWKPTNYNGAGHCRRNAPVFYIIPAGEHSRQCESKAWPYTAQDDWCGEFSQKPPGEMSDEEFREMMRKTDQEMRRALSSPRPEKSKPWWRFW